MTQPHWQQQDGNKKYALISSICNIVNNSSPSYTHRLSQFLPSPLIYCSTTVSLSFFLQFLPDHTDWPRGSRHHHLLTASDWLPHYLCSVGGVQRSLWFMKCSTKNHRQPRRQNEKKRKENVRLCLVAWAWAGKLSIYFFVCYRLCSVVLNCHWNAQKAARSKSLQSVKNKSKRSEKKYDKRCWHWRERGGNWRQVRNLLALLEHYFANCCLLLNFYCEKNLEAQSLEYSSYCSIFKALYNGKSY